MADGELKRCPFCGSGKIQVCYGLDLSVSGIRCNDCGVIARWPKIKTGRNNKTMGEIAKPHIEAWNRRAKDESEGFN